MISRYATLLFILFAFSLSAQEVKLVYPDFPTYDNFNDLYVAPGGQGFALGACGSFLKTTDDGQTWTDAAASIADITGPQAINCAPGTNCQVVYLTASRGLHRSADGGATWSRVDQHRPVFLDFSISGNTFGYLRNGVEIYLSQDDGLNWQSIAIPEQLVDEFIPINAQEWVFFSKSKMYRTTDAGTNWAEVSSFPKDVRLVERDESGNYYVETTGNDVYKSENDGQTFNLLKENAHQYSAHYDLWKDPEDSLHVISFNGSRFSSGDDGATWGRTGNSRFQPYNRFRRAEGRLFATGDGLSIGVATEDWANTRWLAADERPDFVDIQFADETTGYAFASEGELFKTTDGGQSWNMVNNLSRTTGPHFKIDGANLYAFAGDFTLVRSTDGGQNFAVPPFIDDSGIGRSRTIFAPLPGGGLIALGNGKTVKVDAAGTILEQHENTIDINGASWNMTMLSEDFGFVFRTPREAIYRTTDGGATWTEAPAVGFGGFYTFFHFFNEINGITSNGSSTYATTDGGLTWTANSDYPASTQLYTIEDDIFLVTLRGIQRSRDNGATWDPFLETGCNGIRNATRRPGTNEIFALYEGGIELLDVGEVLSSVRAPRIAAEPLSLVPNPNNGYFQVQLPEISGGLLTGHLSIFDLGGRHLLRQSFSNSAPRTVNLADQPAGIYLLQVQLGDQVYRGRVVKR